MIPYGRQDISQADLDAVEEVLRSDFITQGPAIGRFEQAFAEVCGAAQAIAFNSATSALHAACVALGLGPGDVLWTSPNTFVASANCGIYCGAQVGFVDVDPKTYNLCPAALQARLEQTPPEARPKVVVAVHFAGQSCDMKRLRALGDQYGFSLIEDASHAVGGRYGDRAIGACEYSDCAIFSFHPVKIITTGEGGMVTTQNRTLADRLNRLRSHGITREATEMRSEPDGPWYYQQLELGWNYRMTDIQAALGHSQLKRLDQFMERRQALAERYDQLLQSLPVIRPWQDPAGRSAWHLYVIQLEQHDRRRVFEAMRASGIGVNVHYIPIHLQPFYRERGSREGDCPEAERYYHRALSLPMFPALSLDQQDEVVRALDQALTASEQ